MKKDICIRVISIIIAAITFIFSQNYDDSIVAHYKLSEEYFDNKVKGKFYDLSGNGNHATPSDTFQFAADHLGNQESAMRFDGKNDYLNCGDDEKFNVHDKNKTFVFWFKSKFYKDGKDETLFSKFEGWGDYYTFSFKHQGYHLIETEKGGNDTYIRHKSRSVQRFHPETYHLFVYTIDVKKDSVYVYRNCNPNSKYSISKFKKQMSNKGDFYIGMHGCSKHGMDNFFKGKIDEVKIYNRKISKEEMKNMYNNHFPNYYYKGFEDTSMFTGKGQNVLTKCDDMTKGRNINLSTKYYYKGKRSLECTCTPNNKRSEVAQEPQHTSDGGYATYQNKGEERWYSFYILIPESFDYESEPGWSVVTQFFETESPPEGPIYTLGNLNGYFRLSVHTFAEDSIGNIRMQYEYDFNQSKYPVQKGKWHRIVYHLYTQNNNTGYIEAWVDGKSLLPDSLDKFMPKVDNTDEIHYKVRNHRLVETRNLWDDNWFGLPIKIGYYRTLANTTNSIYFDEFKIGNTAKSIDFNPNNLTPNTKNIDINNHKIIFNSIPIGKSQKDELSLTNIGTNNVKILDVLIEDTNKFEIGTKPDSILLPGNSTKIEISFKPQNNNIENSYMLINTNDPIQDSIRVHLQGKGIYPPALQINIPGR
ncbi:MAG: heparin lyase I family protein [Candidatus Marinimicrobia bacterium]|nr:heparin lyase I family protein [Candidatus Neomarinimicrobiota bacterium]